ncbi:GDSL esterase/lipase 7-like [Magnolia sinica]|uniref:GDSL esterase/lipase 7-like n=1 Tax=Magnolia sinica TaxID=86752 RepID=UPI00265A7C19|nr:GDSL esterase/lipase 7-like [Magnolia sinica]
MRKSSISIVFLLGLLLRSLSAKSKEEPLAPALYAFGDSLVDSGNNNGLPTLNKVNYMPHGIDSSMGPQGDSTNGKTVVDFIAQMLGLPFAPPYLGLSRAQRSQIITGVNYASGAAGILPESGRRMGKCISLKEQVDYFQSTIEMDLARNFKDLEAISDHLSKSIFFISIESNDYINNYLQPDYYNTSRQYSSQKFAGFLMHHLSEQLKKLYKLGARKMVIFEIGILGCIPSFTNANNSNGTCVEEVNKFVFEYNRLLPVLLKKLKSDLFGSFFIHGQAFDSGLNVYQNPCFKYTNIPCCIVNHNETKLFIPGQAPCKDRDQHLFWDSFHPTQAANAKTAAGCFNQSTTCSPMNIQQLALIKKDNPHFDLIEVD